MISTLIFAAVLLTLDSVAKAEDKVVIYKTAKSSSPSYNEVPFDASKRMDLLQDLLGLKSIQTLNYNLPTLDIPLLQQPQSQGSFRDEKHTPTSPPPPALPPPPPVSRQKTTPTTHDYPTSVPYRQPTVFYRNIDSNNQHSPPKNLPSNVEYKQLQDGSSSYEKPVTRYVFVSQKPLPSTGDPRELPLPPSALPGPIPPPKRAPAVTLSGPPRIAVHNKYDLEEAKSTRSQSSSQAAKPELSQLIRGDIGPRYYLPQPSAGNEGYYGAFRETPGSFDALLKSDLSFLDHLNYNPNSTEQSPEANAKQESHDSQSKSLPLPGSDQSYKSQPETRSYYPSPPQARPLSAPAIQSYSSAYPTSQLAEGKGGSYHKPVPVQKDDKQHHSGPALDDTAYSFIPTKASQTGKEYPDIQGIYAIQGGNSQPQPFPGYILQHPAVVEYKPIAGHQKDQIAQHPAVHPALVEYKPISGHQKEQVEPNYRAQTPHHNEAPNTYKSQERHHQSSVHYLPEKQSNQNLHSYRPENNLKQEVSYIPEGHNNQRQVNYRQEDHPNQPAINYRPDSHSYQRERNYRTNDYPSNPPSNYGPEGQHNQPTTNYRSGGYPTRSAANFRSEGHPTNAALNYRNTDHSTQAVGNYPLNNHPTRPAVSYNSEGHSSHAPDRYQSANEERRNYRNEGHGGHIQDNYRVEPRPDPSQESDYTEKTDGYQRRPDSGDQEYYDYQQRPARQQSGLRYSSDKHDEARHKEKNNGPTRARDQDDDEVHSYRGEEEERPRHRDSNRHHHRGEATRHRPRSEEYDDDDEPFDGDDENTGHRRLKRQAATVTEKYQRSTNDPSVLKVFRAITVNGTDGVLVDERYVRNKDGKTVNVYTHSQPFTDNTTSTDQNVKESAPTPVEEMKEGYATLTDITTEPTITNDQGTEIPQTENDIPECAKNHSIPICTTDDEYPTEEIVRALTQYSKFVRKLNGLSISSAKDDTESNGPVRPLSDKNWTNICPSYISHIKPLRARNLKGEWKIIVNVNEIRQNLNIETCLTMGEKCSLVPITYQTQCDQKYAVLHLLTYGSKDGLAVDQFLVPAACSCSMAKL